MTAPPVNSDEDYYMEESFDDESLSEVEDEPEEDDVQGESDSRSDSDVEAEFLRGNPHARRQQIFGKCSGGGSGFPREKMINYNSSSEDEAQVVIRKTVAEVNQSKQHPVHTDDETLSDRTLCPNGNPEDSDLTEIGDYDDDIQMEDEIGDEEEEIEFEVEYDGNDLVSEHSNDDQDDDVEVGQLDDEEQDNQKAFDHDKSKPGQPQSELVDVVDCESEIGTCSGESDVEKGSPENSDSEMEFIPVPTVQSKKRLPKGFPNLNRKPILPTPLEKSGECNVPPLPKLEDTLDDNGAEIQAPDGMGMGMGLGMGATDQFNVKFLEQQMTQMSEMIMKTFRLSGGAPDNNAFEQLAMATKLMQKQGKKISDLEEDPESISTVDSAKTPTTVRSEILRNPCRCPSINDDNEPQDESYSMDECGQGDGLMRYPHMQQTQSKRINCRVSSVTPSSFNSDNCGFHVDIRRPRSTASSEKVNYKNVGRKSFSFTNPQVREIERANNILLKKMMNVKPTIKPAVTAVKSSSNMQAKNQAPPAPRLTSAAVNRKKYQRQIDLDNDVLKRKLEAVGSRRPLFK
ncbi:hypothetical protein ACLKA7_009515 [Drosophila subpalustris]